MVSQRILSITMSIILASLISCVSKGKRQLEITEASDRKARNEAEVEKPTTEEIIALTEQAYIYGYPAVLTEVTKSFVTNITKPQAGGEGLNRFEHRQNFPYAGLVENFYPDVKMLYSVAWLDLSQGALELSVPDLKERYYQMPIYNGWGEVVSSPGTRTKGDGKGKFLIVGPGFKGELPKDTELIQVPTSTAWIFGRTEITDLKDAKAVAQLQRGFKLTPSDEFFNTTPIMAGPATRIIASPRKRPVDQVAQMKGVEFMRTLALVLKQNPPLSGDTEALKVLEKLGLTPGQDFDAQSINEEEASAFDEGVRNAVARINRELRDEKFYEEVNGWRYLYTKGSYGNEYLRRAAMARHGLGINIPEDGLHPQARSDIEGHPLSGSQKYILHFAKNQLPPVHGLWSLAVYGPRGDFARTSSTRKSLGSSDSLQYNEDGSLDIYIQRKQPKDKVSNWLPTPIGDFTLVMHMYWPDEVVLSKKWQLPGLSPAPEASGLSQR